MCATKMQGRDRRDDNAGQRMGWWNGIGRSWRGKWQAPLYRLRLANLTKKGYEGSQAAEGGYGLGSFVQIEPGLAE
jgi:hypothetical protein